MSPVPPATSIRSKRRADFGGAEPGDEVVLPQPVQAARHQVVHQVVAAGDGGEHVVDQTLARVLRDLPEAEAGRCRPAACLSRCSSARHYFVRRRAATRHHRRRAAAKIMSTPAITTAIAGSRAGSRRVDGDQADGGGAPSAPAASPAGVKACTAIKFSVRDLDHGREAERGHRRRARAADQPRRGGRSARAASAPRSASSRSAAACADADRARAARAGQRPGSRET